MGVVQETHKGDLTTHPSGTIRDLRDDGFLDDFDDSFSAIGFGCSKLHFYYLIGTQSTIDNIITNQLGSWIQHQLIGNFFCASSRFLLTSKPANLSIFGKPFKTWVPEASHPIELMRIEL
jgi:hypothetical protein